MADRSSVALLAAAAAAWAGALWARALPLLVLAALVAAAIVVVRRPPASIAGAVAAAIAVGALASTAAARADAGATPLERQHHDGVATLVSDPERLGPSVRVDLRIRGGARVEAWARGAAGARLLPRLAGERIDVSGTISPPPPHAHWLRDRHVRGRMSLESVGDWSPGHVATRSANGIRRTLADGATSMDRDQRALYLGLLLGDDRDQSPHVVDDFRGSGLAHLLAVSGSNVAFVLTLATPVLARLSISRRLIATIALLAFFALLTRLEPSVLRATVMAGASAGAIALGRDAESRRILPLAVIALLLVDPFLARSLAFRLSVAASAGIIWWSGRIALALPGPRPVASALGVTTAAQVAVAPLLLPAFGSMPVAALPANLLAAPMAGLVVVWGLPAGLLAGLAGEPVATWGHLPTNLGVGWVRVVAERSAALPLGELTAGHVVLLCPAVAAAVVVSRAWLKAIAILVAVVAVGHPAWQVQARGDRTVELGPGAVLHVAGSAAVLELDDDVRVPDLLEGLRRHGITRIDAVVAHHGGRSVAEAVAAVRERTEPRLVLAPDGHRVPGGAVPSPDATIAVGPLQIDVGSIAPRLEATVRPARAPPPRALPAGVAGRVVGRRAGAPRPSRSSPPPRRTLRRSCRPGRSTTTRAAVRRHRSPGRTASRHCERRRGGGVRRRWPRSPLAGGSARPNPARGRRTRRTLRRRARRARCS